MTDPTRYSGSVVNRAETNAHAATRRADEVHLAHVRVASGVGERMRKATLLKQAIRDAINSIPYSLTDWLPDDEATPPNAAAPKPKPTPRQKADGEGFVYLVQYRDFYKIGVTTQFKKRLIALNNMPDAEIVPIHRFRTFDMRGSEAKLHRLFRAFHRKREWFALDQDAVNDIVAIKDYMLDD